MKFNKVEKVLKDLEKVKASLLPMLCDLYKIRKRFKSINGELSVTCGSTVQEVNYEIRDIFFEIDQNMHIILCSKLN